MHSLIAFCVIAAAGQDAMYLTTVAAMQWNALHRLINVTGLCPPLVSSQSGDGLSTVAFGNEFNRPGSVVIAPDYSEFDIRINSYNLRNTGTIFNTLLHEMGHVYGLSHTHQQRGGIMGLHLKLDSEMEFLPLAYMTLGVPDLMELATTRNVSICVRPGGQWPLLPAYSSDSSIGRWL
jgi:hypothetical protein